jgi:hypothetical protein
VDFRNRLRLGAKCPTVSPILSTRVPPRETLAA